jgi:AraC family transcriptional regulator, regulatory protein of adaptative response / DNA-3-methyladenine glycosylase II
MPAARRKTLTALAEAAATHPDWFTPTAFDQNLEITVQRLRTIPGVREWTAQYIALRAVRELDAFPASDVSLLRAVTPAGSPRPTPTQLLARAESWKPWRGYAAQHLWSGASGSSPGKERRRRST